MGFIPPQRVWSLFSNQGSNPRPLQYKAESFFFFLTRRILNHWTTRGVPPISEIVQVLGNYLSKIGRRASKHGVLVRHSALPESPAEGQVSLRVIQGRTGPAPPEALWFMTQMERAQGWVSDSVRVGTEERNCQLSSWSVSQDCSRDGKLLGSWPAHLHAYFMHACMYTHTLTHTWVWSLWCFYVDYKFPSKLGYCSLHYC